MPSDRQETSASGVATRDHAAGGAPAAARTPRALLARHWPFAVLLGAGLVLRIATQIAYRPGLELFGDSYAYLRAAQALRPDTWHPFGYSLFLRAFAVTGHLWTVVVAQHLLGLAMATAAYGLMLRLGVRPWVAALGTAPILLDAYQLDIEHFVLSETLVEALLLGGLCLLARRDPPRAPEAGIAGALLAAATLTRSVMLPVIGIAVLYLLLRLRWRAALACLVCAALPLLGYAGWFDTQYGTFGMQRFSGIFFYGRVAPFAVCTYPMPEPERGLCQASDPATRPGNEYYVWRGTSPLRHLGIHDNARLDAVAKQFAYRVILHQPFDYARAVAGDTAHYFAPGRPSGRGDPYEVRWRFPGTGLHGPLYHVHVADGGFPGETVHPRVFRPLADALRAYQTVAYTQGPILLAALLGAVAAGLGLLRRRARHRPLRWAASLFAASGFALALGPSLTDGFSYRYGIPLLVTLPVAGALALEVALIHLRRRPG